MPDVPIQSRRRSGGVAGAAGGDARGGGGSPPPPQPDYVRRVAPSAQRAHGDAARGRTPPPPAAAAQQRAAREGDGGDGSGEGAPPVPCDDPLPLLLRGRRLLRSRHGLPRGAIGLAQALRPHAPRRLWWRGRAPRAAPPAVAIQARWTTAKRIVAVSLPDAAAEAQAVVVVVMADARAGADALAGRTSDGAAHQPPFIMPFLLLLLQFTTRS